MPQPIYKLLCGHLVVPYPGELLVDFNGTAQYVYCPISGCGMYGNGSPAKVS